MFGIGHRLIFVPSFTGRRSIVGQSFDIVSFGTKSEAACHKAFVVGFVKHIFVSWEIYNPKKPIAR